MVACHVIASMTLSRQTVSITLEYSHFQSGAAVIFALMARMASKKTHPPTVIFFTRKNNVKHGILQLASLQMANDWSKRGIH